MKNIYNAPNKEVAAAELDNLEKKWGGKYPYAILSWRNKWDDLTVFFQFPLEIRKYTKSKLSFPSDDAVKKTVYLKCTPKVLCLTFEVHFKMIAGVFFVCCRL